MYKNKCMHNVRLQLVAFLKAPVWLIFIAVWFSAAALVPLLLDLCSQRQNHTTPNQRKGVTPRGPVEKTLLRTGVSVTLSRALKKLKLKPISSSG